MPPPGALQPARQPTRSITSAQNPQIKWVVKLRDRKHRIREGRMLVEGLEEVTLALHSGAVPEFVFICPELTHGSLPALPAAVEWVEVSPTVFAKIAYRENPDGWLAVFPIPARSLTRWVLSAVPLLVVAEAIEKPGNLGAILRTADAAGAEGVLVCDPATDIYNPNVVRASKGTLFTVPVAETPSQPAREWLRERHIPIVAATPQARPIYTDIDLRGPVAIAVGTEKEGLSPEWLEQADQQVRIPMLGQVNSLNVATATALLLYEAVRQRQATQPLQMPDSKK